MPMKEYAITLGARIWITFTLLIGNGVVHAQLLCTDSCSTPGPELVVNGDFVLQIQNSLYSTSAPFQIPVWAPATLLTFGQYTITNNPVVHNVEWGGMDHTPSGNTYLLVCDGISGTQTSAWGQDVNISSYAPNTDFVFTAWVNNSIRPQFNWQDPAMQLRVNGTLLLPASQVLPETPDAWVLLEATWNSGPAPPPVVTIEIVSTSTAPIGNDFSIDDISFRACLSAGTGVLSAGSDLTICTADSVQLNATSNSGSILWTPSYGLSAVNIFNPIASPDTTTTYIVVSGQGTPCEATDTLTIYVAQSQATASFQFTIDSCSNQVIFQNLSGSGFDYLWDFGDGTLATLENPVYTYASAGTYPVSLTVTDSCGSSIYTQTITIGSPALAQSLFATTLDSCTNELTLINQSTNATGYFWNFGDGTTSILANPAHIYLNSGTYTVSLIASNGCGEDTSSVQISIQTISPPTATFNYSADSCSNTITFINQSTNSTTYLWNFGDGSGSTDINPVHNYNSTGMYTVILISSGICTSDTQSINITINLPIQTIASFAIAAGTCGDTISFINNSTGYNSVLWNFGDGSISSQINPVHVYSLPGNYVVQLQVSNGCNDSLMQLTLTVPDNLISGSAGILSDSCYTVEFQNLLNNATNYLWDFGNGTTSTGISPVCTYLSPGNYNVTLLASNTCVDTTFNIQVFLNDYSISGSISLSQDSCDLSVNFQAQLLNAVNYWWDFGDGNNSISESGLHFYNSAGSYNVTLTASNECTLSSFMQNMVINPAITPDLLPSLLIDTCLKELKFDHSSTHTFDQHWDFGDGSYSLEQSGTHVFASSGFYNLNFTVNQNSGCMKDTSITIQIEDQSSSFLIPNIITPNNDGLNDSFLIDASPACSPEYIIIFNRWGTRIFESSGKGDFWDGKSNGNYVPSGVYFYVVRFGDIDYKGNLTVNY